MQSYCLATRWPTNPSVESMRKWAQVSDRSMRCSVSAAVTVSTRDLTQSEVGKWNSDLKPESIGCLKGPEKHSLPNSEVLWLFIGSWCLLEWMLCGQTAALVYRHGHWPGLDKTWGLKLCPIPSTQCCETSCCGVRVLFSCCKDAAAFKGSGSDGWFLTRYRKSSHLMRF